MSDIDNGGNAFPVLGYYGSATATMPDRGGMSLRDFFAAKALDIFDMRDMEDRGPMGLAVIAYEIADAMLKVREREVSR